MKTRVMILVAAIAAIAIPTYMSTVQTTNCVQADVVTTMPEVVTLGKDAKLGPVTFNHLKHNGGEYKVNDKQIACTQCHHTAQPAHEAAEHPPLKTVWPADRTTKLSKELFDKDAAAAGVVACQDCHAREGAKPKLLDAIPQIKPEGSTTAVNLTNQKAFHTLCTGCHMDVKKANAASKAPTQIQCVMCHKKTA